MSNKTEYPGMYKVSEGIVVNKDNDALKLYKKKKSRDYANQIEMKNMKKTIEQTQKDIAEIKNLLRSLVK